MFPRLLRHLAWSAVVATALGSGAAYSQNTSAQAVGACVASAVLPDGAVAWCGVVGVPDVTAQFRQGFGWAELQTQIDMNYFDVSFALEETARVAVIRGIGWDLGAGLGVGLVYNAGVNYADTRNYAYGAIRFDPELRMTFNVLPTLRALGELQVPIDMLTTPTGNAWVQPMIGGGLEYSFTTTWSLFGRADIGPLFRQNPGAPTTTDFAFRVQFGLGYRAF